MYGKIRLYYKTLSHLKPIQIRYRVWYELRSIWRSLTGFRHPLKIPISGRSLSISPPVQQKKAYQNGSFTFLNLSHTFDTEIDWNISRYGKLWTYHLNSFSFLFQPGMNRKTGRNLIGRFLNNMHLNRTGMEPYPLSLRGLNWIKFLSFYNIRDSELDAALYAQYVRLFDAPEYHLQGNHLLENGFSLLAGGVYFNDKEFFSLAEQILSKQLPEQVLADGSHIERSPMYHALLLERALDCCNLLLNNPPYDPLLFSRLQKSAERMAGWLERMTFRNGDLPHFNDSTFGIAASTEQLLQYAARLGIYPDSVKSGKSGYRKYEREKYECILDAGDIGPAYQPGHAHSDTFSFILHIGGRPALVDTGISTYEDLERRTLERKTCSHNTFQLDGLEPTRVWAKFRVAERASCRIVYETADEFVAEHDGYSGMGILSRRRFKFFEEGVSWTDTNGESDRCSVGFLHFHPSINLRIKDNTLQSDSFSVWFEGTEDISLGRYSYCEGFNKLASAQKVRVIFRRSMRSHLRLCQTKTEKEGLITDRDEP